MTQFENPFTTVKVHIDGKKREFVSLHLEQSFGEHHRFEIVLDNGFGEKKNDEVFDYRLIGSSVLIELCRGNDRVSIYEFTGIIDEVIEENSKGKHGYLRLKGGSPTILLERGKRMNIFDDMSLSQICRELTEGIWERQLSLSCKPSFDAPLKFLMQYKESDWQFLQRLAALSGETLFYTGQELVFGEYPDCELHEVTYDHELISLHTTTKLIANKFELSDYAPDTNETLYEKSPSSTGSRDKRLNSVVTEGDRLAGGHFPMNVSEMYVENAISLMELAERKKVSTASETVYLKGISKTCDPQIGRLLEVKHTNGEIGRYRVLKVIHETDQNGRYRCEFEAIPSDLKYFSPSKIEMPSVSSMEGTVIDTNDPENMGRIRVDFAFSRDRYCGAWLRVMTPNAGLGEDASMNRGFVFVPEKGDRVMIGFEYNDPNRPFVMGSMFHGKNTTGGGKDNHLKSIITRSGHTIEFDDAEETLGITIKDKSGNRIHFNTKEKNIEITAPETMMLNAKNIAINATENINFQAGESISSQADYNISLSAGEDMQISASNIHTQATDDSIHLAKKHEISGDKVRIDSLKENLELASGKEVDVQSTKKVKLF